MERPRKTLPSQELKELVSKNSLFNFLRAQENILTTDKMLALTVSASFEPNTQQPNQIFTPFPSGSLGAKPSSKAVGSRGELGAKA